MIVLACAACSDRAANSPSSSAPSVAAASATAQSGSDVGKGEGYSYSIEYPTLKPAWSPLDSAIRAFAAEQKKAIQADSAKAGRDRGMDYSLALKFTLARHTSDFVSVLASGDAFTGGAHGLPIVATFNLHPADGKIVALSDLFTDPDAALQALSAEARQQLLGRFDARLRDQISDAKVLAEQLKSTHDMVEDGTAPKAANFTCFLVDGLDAPAIGLALLFPPYQVAPYVDGTVQVEIPAKVFYDLLKPEYKAAFAIDTQANKPGAGVR